jgi:hypothetical protein
MERNGVSVGIQMDNSPLTRGTHRSPADRALSKRCLDRAATGRWAPLLVRTKGCLILAYTPLSSTCPPIVGADGLCRAPDVRLGHRKNTSVASGATRTKRTAQRAPMEFRLRGHGGLRGHGVFAALGKNLFDLGVRAGDDVY